MIETDFAEKYTHQSRINMMMPVYAQTTLMVAIVYFSPQPHEEGGRVHVAETWIFAFEDGKHDYDFHLHALARIADHYLHGGGVRQPPPLRGTAGCPAYTCLRTGAPNSTYRHNFHFLAESVRQIGFFIGHHFAATSHFEGCHDGIGGVAKNAMRRREKLGVRIVGADGVVRFLGSFLAKRGAEVRKVCVIILQRGLRIAYGECT